MTISLAGVFAPVTTPFLNEALEMTHLIENMRIYCKTDLSGIFALGSNGEYKSLNETEKLKILEIIVREKGEHQLIMAGGGHESTRQTIDFCRQLASIGADIVSILTPSYFKKSLTDQALIGYYSEIADALTIPVVVYNAPGFTGLEPSPPALQVISEHPNIIGMKDSSPYRFGRYLEVVAPDFQLLSGSISALLPALILGAVGGVAALANAFPQPCCQLFELAKSENLREARKLHFLLSRLNQAISNRFGVAGLKYAMELGGLRGGLPRRPLLPLTQKGKDLISDTVESSNIVPRKSAGS